MVLILEWGLKEILKRLNVTMENAFHGACEYLMGYKNRGTFRQNLVGWVGNFSEEVKAWAQNLFQNLFVFFQ